MTSSLETLHASEVPVTAPETDNKTALVIAALFKCISKRVQAVHPELGQSVDSILLLNEG